MIFRLNRSILKIAGLSPGQTASWRPWFWMLATGAIAIPLLNYAVANVADLTDTTDVYYVLQGMAQTLVKFYVFWSHMEEVNQVLDDFQRIVDRREYSECSVRPVD